MLPTWIQRRSREYKEYAEHCGYDIEAYSDGGKHGIWVWRYIIFDNGNYVDGGGPYTSNEKEKGMITALMGAIARIDRILEK